jgi:hypothetical protein
MKRLAVILILCALASACITTEDGRRILTENSRFLTGDYTWPAFIAAETGELISAEDGLKLLFEHVGFSLVTEAGDFIVTETNDATLEI